MKDNLYIVSSPKLFFIQRRASGGVVIVKDSITVTFSLDTLTRFSQPHQVQLLIPHLPQKKQIPCKRFYSLQNGL